MVSVWLKPLLALKVRAAASWVLLWNALCVAAIYLNGGVGRFHRVASLLVFALDAAIACAFWLLIVYWGPFHHLVISDRRKHLYDATPYCFLGVLCGALATGAVIAIAIHAY